MANGKITIRDIARWSGVSIATVSRVINGSAGVRPEIKDRILNSIADCGWQSNNLKLRLQLPEPNESVILLSPSHCFSRESNHVMQLLVNRCLENHLQPYSFIGNSLKMMELCCNTRPFATVVYHWDGITEEKVNELVQSGTLTVVIASNLLSSCNCPFFWADPGLFTRAAVEELRKAGHVRIGYFGEFGEYLHYAAQRNIAERAHRRVRELTRLLPGFSPENDTVGDCYGNLDALGKILRTKQHTAWICESPVLAKQLYYKATELGLRIPDEISVVCFSHFCQPPPRWDFPLRFATIGTPLDEIVDQIESILQTAKPPKAEIITLKPLSESGDTLSPVSSHDNFC